MVVVDSPTYCSLSDSCMKSSSSDMFDEGYDDALRARCNQSGLDIPNDQKKVLE